MEACEAVYCQVKMLSYHVIRCLFWIVIAEVNDMQSSNYLPEIFGETLSTVFCVCAEIILLFIQKLAMYSFGFVLCFVLIYWEKWREGVVFASSPGSTLNAKWAFPTALLWRSNGAEECRCTTCSLSVHQWLSPGVAQVLPKCQVFQYIRELGVVNPSLLLKCVTLHELFRVMPLQS